MTSAFRRRWRPFYEPSTDRDVSDAIVGNVLAGLENAEIEAPVRTELEAHVEGTRSYLIVSNLYRLLMASATAALDRGDLTVALRDGRQAAALREEHPGLIVTTEPMERVLVARALVAQGSDAKALVASIHDWYDTNAWVGDPPQALSPTHVEALLVMAAVEGTPTLQACDATFGAILRLSERYERVPWKDRYCAQLAQAPVCSAIYRESGCGAAPPR